MSFLQVLFSPAGRIRRRDFWLYDIGLSIAYYAIVYSAHKFIFDLPDSGFFFDLGGSVRFQPTPFGLVVMAAIVLKLWPSYCLAIKRWHDRNRPWWLAVGIGVMLWILVFVQRAFGLNAAHPDFAIFILAGLTGSGLVIWQFVECGCLDGTKGPNRYGPSPKGVGADPSNLF